jgi:hypothetical protein
MNMTIPGGVWKKAWLVAAGVCAVALLGYAANQSEPKNLPVGIVASHLSGRLLVDGSGQSEMVGYYTFAQGVPNLFHGAVAPANARLSFRTDKFNLASHLNDTLTLLRAVPLGGKTYVPLRVYYNPTPARNFADPVSFEAGQLVATFHTKGSQTTILPDGTAVNTGSLELISSAPFQHDGKRVDIGKALGAVTITLYAKVLPVAGWNNTQWPFGGSATVAGGDEPNGQK